MSLESEELEEKINCLIEGHSSINLSFHNLEVKVLEHREILVSLENSIRDSTGYERLTSVQNIELMNTLRDVAAKQEILLEERQGSIDFWRHMKEKLAGATIIGALGILASVVWYAVISFLQVGPK